MLCPATVQGENAQFYINTYVSEKSLSGLSVCVCVGGGGRYVRLFTNIYCFDLNESSIHLEYSVKETK